MAHEVVMPGLSPGMSQGVIVAWRKAVGDEVRVGDVLFEVETDKAVMEVEASLAGRLTEVRVHAGGPPVDVNAVVAVIAAEGHVAPAPAPRALGQARRPVASPLARRIAQERGVDFSRLPGSGPGGRIVRADVERARPPASIHQPSPRSSPAPSTKPVAHGMSAAIAVPTITLSSDCAVDDLLDFCRQVSLPAGLPGIDLADVLIRIAGIALKRCPALNARWIDGAVVQNTAVNVAISADEKVAVVKSADKKELASIAAEARARGAPDDEPPSLSIARVHGARQFTASLGESLAAALTIGGIEPRPVVIDGGIVAGCVMTCTLTCDARVASAAIASQFLREICAMIEDPRRMLL